MGVKETLEWRRKQQKHLEVNYSTMTKEYVSCLTCIEINCHDSSRLRDRRRPRQGRALYPRGDDSSLLHRLHSFGPASGVGTKEESRYFPHCTASQGPWECFKSTDINHGQCFILVLVEQTTWQRKAEKKRSSKSGPLSRLGASKIGAKVTELRSRCPCPNNCFTSR